MEKRAPTLLLGMQIGVAAMENRGFLKKLKIEPAVLLLGIYLNETENTYLKRYMDPQCS